MNKQTLFTTIMDTIIASSRRDLHGSILSQTSDIVPALYSDPNHFFKDAILVDLLRKCPNPSGDSLEKATMENWLLAERLCCMTNARLSCYRSEFDSLTTVSRHKLHEQCVFAVRDEVARILGRCPSELDPVLTGGATLSDRYGYTSAPDKISTRHTLYWNSNTVGLITSYSATPWSRGPYKGIDICRGNKYFTVPKTSKILRACAKESSLNMPLQRSVGKVISERLSRTGNDIPTGEARHRALAKHASLFDDYATIDCSMASDTISYELVKILLPADWFELLDSLRAHTTEIDGKNIYLNKFSSMGNGFTFELETVLFLAIANVACDLTQVTRDCSQYGDDTILPTKSAGLYMSMLRFFGFVVNTDKSFTKGPFRESCGGDFFRGIQVTTPKIKDLSDCDACYITCLVRVLNIIAPYKGVFVIDRLHARLLKELPLEVRRCGGPVDFGNAVLHGIPESRVTIKARRKNGIEPPSPYQGIRVINYHKGLELDYNRWDEKSFLSICFMTTFPICVEPHVTFSHVGSSARFGSNFIPSTRVERVIASN